MAITINLLQSKLRADLEKKFDPFKLGMLALLLFGVGIAVYFAMKQAEVSAMKSSVRDLTAEYNRLKPLVAAAAAQRLLDDPKLSTIDSLTARLNNRYFWAPTLEAVMKATPGNVQLNSFSGMVDQNGSVLIDLECLAASDEPRAEAETFRTNILDHFKLEDPAASANFPVMVDSAIPVEIGAKKLPTIQFTVQLKYKTSSTPGPAAAAAAPAAPAPAPAAHAEGE